MNLENFYNLRTKHIKTFQNKLKSHRWNQRTPNLTLEIQNQISLLNYSLRQLSQDFSKGGGGHPVKQSVLTRFPCRLLCHMLPKKAYKGGGGGTRVPQLPPSLATPRVCHRKTQRRKEMRRDTVHACNPSRICDLSLKRVLP